MKHFMKLHDEPFELISKGIKTFELRLYDEKRQSIKVGDEIVFSRRSDPGSALLCAVTSIRVFGSFDELYRALPLLECGYNEETLLTAKPDDMARYYSPDKEKAYGVVGIGIKMLNGVINE